MTPQETYDKNLWWVLQEIKKEILMQDYDGLIVIKIDFVKSLNKSSPTIDDIKHILRNQLEKRLKVLDIVEKYTSDWNDAHRFILQINRQKFDRLYIKYQNLDKRPSRFKLFIKDRNIYINDYLIARPHSVGSNLEFLEVIRANPNKKIKNKDLEEELRERLGNKTFFKMLNALGFEKEIKKAYFYKVTSNELYYRGDTLSITQLNEAGVKIDEFIKQLHTKHKKYTPK